MCGYTYLNWIGRLLKVDKHSIICTRIKYRGVEIKECKVTNVGIINMICYVK